MAEYDQFGRIKKGYTDDSTTQARQAQAASSTAARIPTRGGEQGLSDEIPPPTYLMNPNYFEGSGQPKGLYTNMPPDYVNTSPMIYSQEDLYSDSTGFYPGDSSNMGGANFNPLLDDSPVYKDPTMIMDLGIDTNPYSVGFEDARKYPPLDEPRSYSLDNEFLTRAFVEGARGEDPSYGKGSFFSEGLYFMEIDLADSGLKDDDTITDFSDLLVEEGFISDKQSSSDIPQIIEDEPFFLDKQSSSDIPQRRSLLDLDTFSVSDTVDVKSDSTGNELRGMFERNEDGSYGERIGTILYNPETNDYTGYSLNEGFEDRPVEEELEKRGLFQAPTREGIETSPEETSEMLQDPNKTRSLVNRATWNAASKVLKQLDIGGRFTEQEKAAINKGAQDAAGVSPEAFTNYIRNIKTAADRDQVSFTQLFNADLGVAFVPPTSGQKVAFEDKVRFSAEMNQQVYNPTTNEYEYVNRLGSAQETGKLFSSTDAAEANEYIYAYKLIQGIGGVEDISQEKLLQIQDVIENPREFVPLYNPNYRGRVRDLLTDDKAGGGGSITTSSKAVQQAIRIIVAGQETENNARKSLLQEQASFRKSLASEFATIQSQHQSVMASAIQGEMVSPEAIEQSHRLLRTLRMMEMSGMSQGELIQYQSEAAKLVQTTTEPILNGIVATLNSMGVPGLAFQEKDFRPLTKEQRQAGEISDYDKALALRSEYYETWGMFKNQVETLQSMINPANADKFTSSLLTSLGSSVSTLQPGDIDQEGNPTNIRFDVADQNDASVLFAKPKRGALQGILNQSSPGNVIGLPTEVTASLVPANELKLEPEPMGPINDDPVPLSDELEEQLKSLKNSITNDTNMREKKAIEEQIDIVKANIKKRKNIDKEIEKGRIEEEKQTQTVGEVNRSRMLNPVIGLPY